MSDLANELDHLLQAACSLSLAHRHVNGATPADWARLAFACDRARAVVKEATSRRFEEWRARVSAAVVRAMPTPQMLVGECRLNLKELGAILDEPANWGMRGAS